MGRIGIVSRRSRYVLGFAGLLVAGLLFSVAAASAANDPDPDWEPIELDVRSIRIYGPVALVKGIMAYRLAGAKQNNGYRNALFVLVKDAEGWRIVERHPIPLRSAPPPK